MPHEHVGHARHGPQRAVEADAGFGLPADGLEQAGVDRLLRFLEELQQRPPGHPDGGPMHLDGAYSTFRAQNPDVVTLIASPNLGWQRSSRSDIYPNAWFDRVPGFRQLAGAARTSKTWLKRWLSS